MVPQTAPRGRPDDATVVSKAVMRAAGRLELPNRALASILGLSEASVSRMAAGAFQVSPGTKPFELAVLFLRMFRSLDAIANGDATVARSWLRNDNTAIGIAPVKALESITGLVNVVAYLDARRAVG